MKNFGQINSFAGGINNNSPANQLQPNEVIEAYNMVIDERSNLASRNGVVRINKNKNLLTKTEDFSHANWAKSGTPVIVVNTEEAPDGTISADSIQDDDNTATEVLFQSKSCLDDEIYTASVHVKKGEFIPFTSPALQIRFTGSVTFQAGTVFLNTSHEEPIENITVATGAGLLKFGVEDVGDYWRVWLTCQNNAVGNTAVSLFILPAATNGFGSTTIDPSALGTKTFWGAQLERGKLSPYYANNTVAPTQTSNYLFSRITSIYNFRKIDNSEAVLVTSGSDCYRLNSDDYLEKITDTLSLPNDTYWQWVTFDGVAIAVNRGIGEMEDNPVKLETTSGVLEALGGTAPKGRYIEKWQNRVWIVREDAPNTVRSSALGDAEDYITTGAAGSQEFEIGGAENSELTGTKVFKDRLFFFKADKIYYMDYDSADPADITKYVVKEFSKDIGYISGYSVQEVINDLVGLSRYGIVPLSATDKFGSFEFSVISRNIKELINFSNFVDTSASIVNPEESQYILSFSSVITGIHDKTFVGDFSQSQQGLVGFTEFGNKMIAASFGRVLFEGRDRVYVGGYPRSDDEGIAYLYRYGDESIFDDDGDPYPKKIKTGAYNEGAFTVKKRYLNWEVNFEMLSNTLDLSFAYRFDESPNKEKTFSKSFSALLFTGAVWDFFNWDNSNWADVSTAERILRKALCSPVSGRIGRSVQFIIECGSSVGFKLKGFLYSFVPLTSKVK